MFPGSLDKKPLFKKPDQQIIRDLTKSMFDNKANSYVDYTAYKIPSEYEMRPDLVAQAVYNNIIYTEFILKYNGISNPFTIDKDDIILIPNLNSAKENVKIRGETTDKEDSNEIRKSYKYIDPTKKPIRDKDLTLFENRKLKRIQEGALPPNITEEGAEQISYRNGRVYFGESIAQSACLKNGMTSSEFLTKVIRSRKV